LLWDIILIREFALGVTNINSGIHYNRDEINIIFTKGCMLFPFAFLLIYSCEIKIVANIYTIWSTMYVIWLFLVRVDEGGINEIF